MFPASLIRTQCHSRPNFLLTLITDPWKAPNLSKTYNHYFKAYIQRAFHEQEETEEARRDHMDHLFTQPNLLIVQNTAGNGEIVGHRTFQLVLGKDLNQQQQSQNQNQKQNQQNQKQNQQNQNQKQQNQNQNQNQQNQNQRDCFMMKQMDGDSQIQGNASWEDCIYGTGAVVDPNFQDQGVFTVLNEFMLRENPNAKYFITRTQNIRVLKSLQKLFWIYHPDLCENAGLLPPDEDWDHDARKAYLQALEMPETQIIPALYPSDRFGWMNDSDLLDRVIDKRRGDAVVLFCKRKDFD